MRWETKWQKKVRCKSNATCGICPFTIHKVSQILNKDGVYSKKLDIKFIETTVKKNFSLCWRWFYRMQIPMIIGYHEVFEDVATFHVWGTVTMNQAFNYKKNIWI